MNRKIFVSFLLLLNIYLAQSVSAEDFFVGPTGSPTIYNPHIENLTNSSAWLVWSTDLPSISRANIIGGGSNTRCNGWSTTGPWTSHCIQFTNLTPGTSYSVQPVSYTYSTGIYNTTAPYYSFETPSSSGSGSSTGGTSDATSTASSTTTTTDTSTTNTATDPTTSTTSTSTTSGGSGSSSTDTSISTDTTPPKILQFGFRVDELGRLHAGASFSESVDKNSLNSSNVFIVVASTNSVVDSQINTYSTGVDVVLPATIGGDQYYQLVVRNIRDLSGNVLTTEFRSNTFKKPNSTDLNVTNTTQTTTSTSTTSTQTTTTSTTNTTTSTTTGSTLNTTDPIPTQNTSTIILTVKDNQGVFVNDARVYIKSTSGTVIKSDITRFSAPLYLVVPTNTYYVEVFPPTGNFGFSKPTPVKIILSPSQKYPVTITLNRVVKTVKGFVTYSNQTPVPDAVVGAYRLDGTNWTEVKVLSNGAYTLNLTEGKWQIGVRPNSESANWEKPTTYSEIFFTADGISETRIENFSIPLSDGIINVYVVDEKGIPLPNIGIIIDSENAGDDTVSAYRFRDYRITNTDGFASFKVRSNTYFIRAGTTNAKLIAPAEEKVIASSGTQTKVDLVFKNISNATNLLRTIQGIVRFQDGKAVADAFIYLWSEEGESHQYTSNYDGTFEFKITKNNNWRIGARKEIDRTPYKTSEMTVPDETQTNFLELIVIPENKKIPLASEATGTLTQDLTAKISDGAEVKITANSASSAVGGIEVNMRPTIETPTQAGTTVVGIAYNVSVIDNYGESIERFDKKIEIILPYTDQDLKDLRANEGTIRPGYFDETTNLWVTIDDYTIDTVKNIIIARVDHLTRFAIISAADITPPNAPDSILATVIGTTIRLSWHNPSTDFDHAKIYRSTKKQTLGNIIASEIPGSIFSDTTTKKGITYYYTVRSVDPAGNESINSDQKTIDGVGETLALIETIPIINPVAISTPTSKITIRGPKILRNLNVGSSGKDVVALQRLLKAQGYLSVDPTGYFGKMTQKAIIAFQETHKKEILIPNGLTNGTGFVGKATRKKLNEFITLP